jgi:hypothetical protein
MPWSVLLGDGRTVVDVRVRRVQRRTDFPENAQAGYSDAYARDLVYVGAVLAGSIFRGNAPGSQHRIQWSAVSAVKDPKGLRLVEGFGARRDAVTYLLRAGGWWE